MNFFHYFFPSLLISLIVFFIWKKAQEFLNFFVSKNDSFLFDWFFIDIFNYVFKFFLLFFSFYSSYSLYYRIMISIILFVALAYACYSMNVTRLVFKLKFFFISFLLFYDSTVFSNFPFCCNVSVYRKAVPSICPLLGQVCLVLYAHYLSWTQWWYHVHMA